MKLNRRQIEHFFDVGFVEIPGLFRPDEVARIRAAFDRLEREAYELPHGTTMHRGSQFVLDAGPSGRTRIQRVVWCGSAEPELDAIGRDCRLLEMAAQLLGISAMDQLINQAHFKLPGDGVEFPWHQDSTHRRFGEGPWRDLNGRGSYVQIVVAVDDIAPDNGPLRFIPGSCREGHVDDPDRRRRILDSTPPVTPLTEAGGAVLFGPYTFHGSEPNRSSRPRRVFINGFAYPGANTRIYPGEGAGRRVEIPQPTR